MMKSKLTYTERYIVDASKERVNVDVDKEDLIVYLWIAGAGVVGVLFCAFGLGMILSMCL